MTTPSRRQVKTPGAPEATTQPAADQQPADSSVQTGDENQKPQEQEHTDDSSSIDTALILVNQEKILDGQKRIENKLDQLLSAGGIEAPKKLRWVQGKNGHELKEA
jgi:hypothetical protein